MEKIVDARGKSCPMPVIMTKKEIDNLSSGIIRTIVDNEVAKENVSKLVKNLGYEYSVDEKSNKEFHIIIKLDENAVIEEKNDEFKDLVLGFSKDIMGSGDRKLGEILIKSYIYTVRETLPLPKALLFFNTGVNLTCEGSQVLEDLKYLESKGVEIVSCGTCLDFLNRKEDLGVGSISNMYTIYETLREAASNIVL